MNQAAINKRGLLFQLLRKAVKTLAIPSLADFKTTIMLVTKEDYTIEPIKVYYLEMHSNPRFILPDKETVSLKQLKKPVDVETYRRYYKSVGWQYNWLDRLTFSDEELAAAINAGHVEIFVLQINNEDAGYAEFAIINDYVEIVYFGLFAEFIGRGTGKFFLYRCVNKAWSYNPGWIQLNTCALDHPNALGVYQSAGFEIVRTAMEDRKVLLKNKL